MLIFLCFFLCFKLIRLNSTIEWLQLLPWRINFIVGRPQNSQLETNCIALPAYDIPERSFFLTLVFPYNDRTVLIQETRNWENPHSSTFYAVSTPSSQFFTTLAYMMKMDRSIVGNKANGRISKQILATRKQSSPNFPKNEHFYTPRHAHERSTFCLINEGMSYTQKI